MRPILVATLVFGLSIPATGDDAPSARTTRHLLAGVRAFKAHHYDEALVELRVVAAAPDAPADLAFYLGPTLYKLGRDREALRVFVTSRAPRDALTDFYLGETYYRLRLYRKAHDVFARLRTRGLGPALDEAAGRYVAAIDLAYRQPPGSETIDAYLAEGQRLLEHDPVIAAEYLGEARDVEAFGPARHRHDEIEVALARAWNAAGRAGDVAEMLAGEPSLSAEGRWQLASAYVALGNGERARPLLEAIAKEDSPHASEAVAMLAKLPQ